MIFFKPSLLKKSSKGRNSPKGTRLFLSYFARISNLLFNNDDIVIIDFLDTFLDSPIQDIVKIRQDTQFHWSLRMLKHNYDSAKIIQCLNYIDNKLHNEFKKYDFYLNSYKIFQILNFLRIIPYCNNDYDVQFLKKRIKLLCSQR